MFGCRGGRGCLGLLFFFTIMKNPIKAVKDWWAGRRQRRRIGDVAGVFATIEKLVKSNLLYWDEKQRQLLIAEPLATVMLVHGADGWTAFLNNVFLYVSFRFMSERWNNRLLVRQAKAIAKAKAATPGLSAADIQRIKLSEAERMSAGEVQLPAMERIDFYIVSEAEGKTEPALCGFYDPQTDKFDIVEWSEVAGRATRASSK